MPSSTSSLALQSTLPLSSKQSIPVLGLGVWDSPSDVTTNSCLSALKAGYRHIDTAEVYSNEIQVGQALSQSGLPRNEIFITSKIFQAGKTPESTREKLLRGIQRITDPENAVSAADSKEYQQGEPKLTLKEGAYLDLMLIHNMSIGSESYLRIWREMETLHKEGSIKSLGVSNFGIAALENLKKHATVWPPAVNQLELHPWLQQREIVSYCVLHGIAVEAYCPIVRNQKKDDEKLKKIAEEVEKSTTQVLIRYGLQKGWIPLPKSDNEGRIRENSDVFGWELTDEQMNILDEMEEEEALVVKVNNDKA